MLGTCKMLPQCDPAVQMPLAIMTGLLPLPVFAFELKDRTCPYNRLPIKQASA